MAGGGKEKPVKPLGWVWFTGLMLGIAACLPFTIEYLCSKAYPTHRGGVVVVTQATNTAGKAACAALLEDGYVVLGGVADEKEAQSITALGNKKLTPFVIDLNKPDTLDAAVDHLKQQLKGRDFAALINTIEAGHTSPVETHDLASMKRLFEVNTFGTLTVLQKFLPLVREQGSRIVLMSSLCAHLTPPLFGGLCASKAALESLADGLRRELMPYKISVSSIEPVVATPEGDNKASTGDGVYAHLYEAKAQALVRESGADDATAAIGLVIMHAVSSTHPKLRYPVGKIGHLPASLVAVLSWGLPGRLQDVLLA